MHFNFRPWLRPTIAGWLSAVLLTLLTVAATLADGTGPPFPH
jgi:hypothetical protein